MQTDTSERGFQNDIIAHLVAHGYHKRGTETFHKASCIDPELALKFVQDTQPKEWKRFKQVYSEDTEKKFLIKLVKELNNKGTIHILRHGFKDVGTTFRLFYPKPNNKKNPDLFDKYDKNLFSVIEELEYENRERGNRIDLVVFINGLPVLTIELKDTFSQGVERAITQYRTTRDPRETIFQRCLVHFAVSDEKVFMSTRLDGEKTRFLPFNKGLVNPQPLSPNDYQTSYLYQEILQKDQLSRLFSNFIYLEKSDNDLPIFPRYHQLDCVNKLMREATPGTNYLVQHSAGSGKTKTIAWLSHGLITKFNRLDNRVYDIVIVVSDRKVIDKQLQEQVQQIEKRKGIVDKIEKNSDQLKEALKSGSNIVVTTIQKFPFILDEMGNLPKRNYAVIIDEAHSSQTGTMAKKMKRVLATNSLNEAETLDNEDQDEIDEEILREIESSRRLKNVSFFAFTATPKNKTLETFGVEGEDGKFYSYHLYSMKQAIDEGFILDVLKHYLPYETYFKLAKKIQDDPEYDDKKARKLLRNYVEVHPAAIDKKTDIMLSHFMNSTINKIDGKGKAMIVTRSRLHAVLYKRAFDKAIKAAGYSIKTLVAFTGKVEYPKESGKVYTEDSMNGLPSKKSIRKAFNEDDYKVLIVANKFQTGFDQPLLHTMYVDKVLNGVTAVQTLSRVNRIHPPHKNDTLIIDFANKTEVIQKSFKPYYEASFLKERTDYKKLYDLQEKALEFYIYDESEIETFVKKLRRNVHQTELHRILNPMVDIFRNKTKKQQVEFKKTLRRFQNIYSFLSQIMPFPDVQLEKTFIFHKYLLKKLPTINDPLPFNVLEDVDMDSYKIATKGKRGIQLVAEGELKPISATVGEFHQEHMQKLSLIIKELNDAFGTDFTEDDRVFLTRVKDNLSENKDLMNKFEHNSRQNVKAVFDGYFEEEMTKLLNSNLKFYKRIVDNDKLRKRLKSSLFELVYEDFSKSKINYKKDNLSIDHKKKKT
ncbi:type I restriction endonuclease subunit R [Candidatus Woesearchaeota archaeon]|nr:type I restriction endonuclease subunit R [Candidatus Woesearchaeota archaeon]